MNSYLSERAKILAIEESMRFGSQIELTPAEKKLSNWLSQIKNKEYDVGIKDPSKFLAARHFFQSRPEIEESEIFKFIQRMPKGAVLHAHDWGLVSQEFLFELTYMDNLYMTESNGQILFKFSKKAESTKWSLVSDLRKKTSNLIDFNRKIQDALTICVDNPHEAYPNGYAVWRKFQSIFGTIMEMLTYKPAHEKYWNEVFEEMLRDNIMYMEFRGTLPDVYDLDGKIYSGVEVVRIYKELADKFKHKHPEFLGIKFIYAPFRRVDSKCCAKYVEMMKQLLHAFPDFIAGFDLVGQEELGAPLVNFIHEFQQIKSDVKFFFHAGETNWNGSSVDLNLIDAILLKSKRIGHGYALFKHPYLSTLVKKQDIAVEVCPVSNHVLGLVSDLRNHPAAELFAQDFPLVVCCDDPMMWEARGLSYDFYVVFMAIMNKSADLRALKKLALNSIKYSAMNCKELNQAYAQFDKDWEIFVNHSLKYI